MRPVEPDKGLHRLDPELGNLTAPERDFVTQRGDYCATARTAVIIRGMTPSIFV